MADNPPQVPADRRAVEEMRRILDSVPDSGWEMFKGGIDDEGIPFVVVRKKSSGEGGADA